MDTITPPKAAGWDGHEETDDMAVEDGGGRRLVVEMMVINQHEFAAG